MRKCLAGVVCAVLVVATLKEVVAASKEDVTRLDGKLLLMLAASNEAEMESYYTGYVQGIVDGYAAAVRLGALKLFCIKEPISGADIADVVRVWLRQNPQAHDKEARGLVLAAMTAFFPCEQARDE